VDWVYLAQGQDSIKVGNLLSNQVTINFLRRTLFRGISYSPQTRKDNYLYENYNKVNNNSPEMSK
jgi:hypothetical protein